MKKRIVIVSLILATVALFLWRMQPVPTETVPEAPTAVLFSSLAEMWQSAGGSVDITVGETVERGIVQEALLVDEGAGKSINTELLVSYRPQLVIYSIDVPEQVRAAELMEKNGVQTLGCKVDTFTDYERVIRQMSELTGCVDVLDLVNEQRRRIDKTVGEQTGKGKTILFIRAGSSASSTKAKRAEDHFACAMLEEMGCINLADGTPILTESISMETVVSAQPDVIFFSLMGKESAAKANVVQMLESEAWQSLKAVQENRTYILPKDLFHFKPCARWAESYEYLSNILKEDF